MTLLCLVKAMVFTAIMYGCESWTIKKAEHWIIYAFELWCWRRPLRVPWTARRSNQSILKECALEGLMLKLKQQYFGHLMQRTDSFEKTLMLGKIEGGRRGDDRGWDAWMVSLTWWTWVWASSRRWWWTGKPGVLQSMRLQRVGHDWANELNWTIQRMHSVLFEVWTVINVRVCDHLFNDYYKVNLNIHESVSQLVVSSSLWPNGL